MDSRVAAELVPPVYEDFDPSSEMVQEKDFDTILINLPGFRKDHLKVQLTTSKILRISGSRLAENNKWRRFQKEFPVTPGRDPQRISAKFEGGILYVKVPMMIPTTPTPAMKKEEKEKKSPVTPPEKLPSDDQQKPAQKNDSKMEELPREKKEEKSPEDKKSNINAGGDDNNKQQEDQEKGKMSPEDQKNTSDRKPEADNKKAKNQPDEEKTRDLDDIKEKKSVAEGDKDEKLDKKATDDNKKDHKHSETTTDGVDENENLASKLKKHRRMFNLALVTILTLAIGIYVSDLFKSLRRRIQN